MPIPIDIRPFLAACALLLIPGYAAAQDLKPVVVAEVIEAEVKTGQRFVGTVHPRRISTIGSAIDGRVEKFLVKAGEPVTKGQPLARLRTATLEIEKAIASAELELYVQRLAELQNGARPEDIAEADANMRSAAAALENAESTLRRIESLGRAVSTAERDDARERAHSAKFAFKAMEALHKRIKDGARVETIAQARAQVELQQQRLNLAKDRIAKAEIIAPFDGFVAAEYTEVGDWITRGAPIAEVIQMDEVEVQALVTAEAVVSLRKGDVIRIEFPELPEQLLTGTIDRIVPVADSRARTFPVHVRLPNRFRDGTPLLMAGMLARLDLPAGKRQAMPLVPKDALVLNGVDRCVFVVDSEGPDERLGKVRKVRVDLGVAVDDRIQVRGAIREGDRVVVVGNERLIPNTPVKIVRDIGSTDP